MTQKCTQRIMEDIIPLCLMQEGIRMDSVKEFEQKRREEFFLKKEWLRQRHKEGAVQGNDSPLLEFRWNLGYKVQSS